MEKTTRTAKFDPWMNATQAAKYLAFPSIKAFYQAIRRGQIPVYRLGSRLRFKREELDELLERQHQLTVDDILIS